MILNFKVVHFYEKYKINLKLLLKKYYFSDCLFLHKFYFIYLINNNQLLLVRERNYLNWLITKINFYIKNQKKIYFFFDNLFLTDTNILHYFMFNKFIFFHYFWFFNFELFLLKKKKWYLYFIKLFQYLKIDFVFLQSNLYKLFSSIQKFKFLMYFQNIFLIKINFNTMNFYYLIWFFLQLSKLIIFNFLNQFNKYHIFLKLNSYNLIN